LKVASAASRYWGEIRPILTLTDRAADSSVITQSLTANPEFGCDNQAIMRSVSASLVKAATTTEVSR
jgi:hypothetical protein